MFIAPAYAKTLTAYSVRHVAIDGNASKNKRMCGWTYLITTVPVVGVKLQAKNKSCKHSHWNAVSLI